MNVIFWKRVPYNMFEGKSIFESDPKWLEFTHFVIIATLVIAFKLK